MTKAFVCENSPPKVFLERVVVNASLYFEILEVFLKIEGEDADGNVAVELNESNEWFAELDVQCNTAWTIV